MEIVPEILNYSTIKPPGIPSRITRQRYNPSSPAPQLRPGDFVRFEINSTGFWDPYLAYMNIDVDFSGGEDHVVYQIDGSAHSAFRSMTMTARGVELERINEYDVLANALIDVHYPIHKRYTRSLEGLGYSNYSNQTYLKMEGGAKVVARSAMLFGGQSFASASTTTPSQTVGNNFDMANATTPFSATNWTASGAFTFPVHCWTTQNYGPEGPDDYNLIMTGQDMQASFATAHTGRYGYPPRYLPCVFRYKTVTGGYAIDPANDNRLVYISGFSGNDVTFGVGINAARAMLNQNGTCGIDTINDNDLAAGATRGQMFNYALSNASFEPCFTNGKIGYYDGTKIAPSPGKETNLGYYLPGSQPNGWLVADKALQYTRPVISSGKFNRSPITSGSFSLPIMSGILGVLMPKSAYKLIPMGALPNLTLEFQISPYLVFTSGYANIDTNSINNQPKRSFTITRFELLSDQYLFTPEVEAIIMGNYRKGETLYIHTHSFLLGPTYSIVANQLPGTVQINLGFESLKSLMWIFLAQDYQTWSWCRRQYRLSHNVTKIQAKIGMEYYPSTPSLTNAGNLAPLIQSSSISWQRPNNEYWIDFMKAWGKYNDRTEDTWISPQNFAINDRPYSPDNFKTQVGLDRNGKAYQAVDCQWGMPAVHENRCVGRAMFAIDLETLTNEPRVLSGVNTTAIKPFDLVMEYQSDGTGFKGNSMMLPYCWYDFVIALNVASINVIGKS